MKQRRAFRPLLEPEQEARCCWPAWLITPLLNAPEKFDNWTHPPIVEERRATNGMRAANARFCSAHKAVSVTLGDSFTITQAHHNEALEGNRTNDPF